MVSNPFRFGKEVSGDQFYDRQEAFEKLYRDPFFARYIRT